MKTRSGPFVNESALRQMGDTARRASAYEDRGYSPRDAWETAAPFGSMGGNTPVAGYSWGFGN